MNRAKKNEVQTWLTFRKIPASGRRRPPRKRILIQAGGEGGYAPFSEAGSPVPSTPDSSLPPSTPVLPPARALPLAHASNRPGKVGRAISIQERKWLAAYLDEDNPDAFFNVPGAAKAAGFQSKNKHGLTKVGQRCLRKLRPHIKRWLDDVGLSEEKIRMKIMQGLDCRETRFFSHLGNVTDERDVIPWAIRAKFYELAARTTDGMMKDRQKGDGVGNVTVVINNNFPLTPECMVGVAIEGRDWGRLPEAEKVPSEGSLGDGQDGE